MLSIQSTLFVYSCLPPLLSLFLSFFFSLSLSFSLPPSHQSSYPNEPVSPVSLRVRMKILPFLLKSTLAANTFPACVQVNTISSTSNEISHKIYYSTSSQCHREKQIHLKNFFYLAWEDQISLPPPNRGIFSSRNIQLYIHVAQRVIKINYGADGKGKK